MDTEVKLVILADSEDKIHCLDISLTDDFTALYLGTSGSKHVGLVYEGCRPGDGEVADLLNEAGLRLD